MGIHKSQHTLMSHDNRKKKQKKKKQERRKESQWYTESAKADIAYGKYRPKQILVVVGFFLVRNNAA